MPYLEVNKSQNGCAICIGCRKLIEAGDIRLVVRKNYDKRRYLCRECGAVYLEKVLKRYKKNTLGVITEEILEKIWDI